MSADGQDVKLSSAVTPSLIVPSKLRIPVSAEPCIDRHGLIAVALDSAHPLRRVLVTGPAGSGKTTLLATWCRRLEADGLVSWLSLDEGDVDPVRLWAHLLHGVQSWSPRLCAEALTALEGGASIVDVVLPLFLLDLSALDRPAVIVLDDVHSVNGGEARASLHALARQIPTGTTLAVSSRQGLNSEEIRWVFNEEAHHISSDDLRFTSQDIARLAADLSTIQLSTAEATRLERATGGWAAPLRFACRQMGDEGAEAALRALGEADMEDYVVSQVLSAASDVTTSSLALLASLDRFSHRLVADLAPEASEALAPARREALGIRHLGDGWFAFHDLVRDVLLRRVGGAPETEALAAAARWFSEQGLLEEAARYAVACGECHLAAHVLNEMWPTYIETGRVATLTMLMQSLSADQTYGDALLLVTAAWIAGFTHDLAERDRLLDTAELIDWTSPLPDGTESVAHAAALNRCLIPSDYPSLMANAARAQALTPVDSPWMSFVLMGTGTALLADGDYAACARVYLDAAARVSPLFQVACIGGAALASAMAGDLRAAADLADQAAHQRVSADLGHVSWVVFHEVAKGYVKLRAGSPREAAQHFSAAESGLAELIEPYPALAAFLGSAECHAQLGDREAAADAIARAEERAEAAGDIGDHFEGLLAEARLAFAAERPIAHAVSIEPLTDRELAVLRLLATTQLSQAEIADTLFVSHNTVKSHTKAIYRKLHVSSRGRAAERAGQLGLLSRGLTLGG